MEPGTVTHSRELQLDEALSIFPTSQATWLTTFYLNWNLDTKR
jgi:hypothetical protein